MKKILALSALVLLISLARCTKPDQDKAVRLMADPKFRAETMLEIFNNEEYLGEFSENMTESKIKPVITRMNVAVVKTIWESDKMDSLINADATITQKMANRVLRKMDNDTSAARLMFEKLMENERFKNYVIKYNDRKK